MLCLSGIFPLLQITQFLIVHRMNGKLPKLVPQLFQLGIGALFLRKQVCKFNLKAFDGGQFLYAQLIKSLFCCFSLNMAFSMAKVLEQNPGESRRTAMENFSDLAAQGTGVAGMGSAFDIMQDFDTFELYYGIHLEEDGNIIS